MSRCKACDKKMTYFEMTRKYADNPTQYVDLCNDCFSTIASEIAVLERVDLLHVEDDTLEEM